MKLTDWAKLQGVCYRSAWNYFHAGKIPGAFRLPSGAIIVPDEKPLKKEHIVTYARVSSSENKDMKVAVGLSGGVDSAVAASILKEQGYEQVSIEYDPKNVVCCSYGYTSKNC